MKKIVVNTSVFIIAVILAYILFPIGFIASVIINLVMVSNKDKTWYFYMSGYGIDQLGNVLLSPVFNLILIKSNGYKFGCPDETISGVIGKNYILNTLTGFGKSIRYILDKIDPNHVTKSIEEDEDYNINI